MPEQDGHERGTAGQLNDDDKRVAALARRFDCLTEEELATLAGVQVNTLQAWRKRHKGPPYIRFGNRWLYPRKPASRFLEQQVRNPGGEATE